MDYADDDEVTQRYVEDCEAQDKEQLRQRYLAAAKDSRSPIHLAAPSPSGPVRRMTELARSFPSLRHAPGVDPFDVEPLDCWAAGKASHGEALAARFVLAVWSPEEAWEAGRFDVMEALRVWDLPHREAFLKWASDPWWP